MEPEFPAARARVARLANHVLPKALGVSSTSATPASRFEGQVCIVTGAARGIGRTIAERLAKEGAKAVCIFDAGDSADAVSAVRQAAPGVSAQGIRLELASEAEVMRAVDGIVREFGKVDVLVQAAGITGKTNVKTHEVDTADFSRVFDVNVKALFLCAKAVLPSMIKEGYGRIVNIASISGKEGNAGMLAYSASKAAAINLTKVIGKDYVNMGKDITCNCIAPAVVRTAMVDAMPPEQVKYMTDKIPMARTGQMEEVAATVCFAASRECSFTTGFCFDCSGGRAVY